MYILCKVDKTGATVFKDIIDQFLYNTEYDQFLFGFQPFAVVMKTAAGIHGTRAADLLKQIVYG
ncbi:hypothetical protein D9M68_948150 [compost metagenome]